MIEAFDGALKMTYTALAQAPVEEGPEGKCGGTERDVRECLAMALCADCGEGRWDGRGPCDVRECARESGDHPCESCQSEEA